MDSIKEGKKKAVLMLKRAGKRISNNEILVERAGVVALIWKDEGEETFERYLIVKPGDKIKVN